MGQAKRRGTLEDRIKQAQSAGAEHYPATLPLVTLEQLTPDSPWQQIATWMDHNADYLSTYTDDDQPPVYTQEQARQLVKQEAPKWISCKFSQVHVAINDLKQVVGYVTTHWGNAAMFHADSPESLIEDIYVAPEHRHQGYMTAIRQAANTANVLVHAARLRRLVGYYRKAGFSSFNVRCYTEHNTQPEHHQVLGLMKPSVVLRRDNLGQYSLCQQDIDQVRALEKDLMQRAVSKLRLMDQTAMDAIAAYRPL
jgi:GNAT superfamily N-acetyltransferase